MIFLHGISSSCLLCFKSQVLSFSEVSKVRSEIRLPTADDLLTHSHYISSGDVNIPFERTRAREREEIIKSLLIRIVITQIMQQKNVKQMQSIVSIQFQHLRITVLPVKEQQFLFSMVLFHPIH